MQITYIETESKDAAFHFSVEEYILRHFPLKQPVMMIWQADRCVMLGSYQVANAEIDIGRASRENVQIVRRSSGGGAIYNDLGVLLYTIITPYEQGQHPQQAARDKAADIIVRALNQMGVPAKFEGRNDIIVDGKKVSGLAQYARDGRICTHGSLLYDADLEMLAQILRVDEEKIRSKAIRSVRSRVTNIAEHINPGYSTAQFMEKLKWHIFKTVQPERYELCADDLARVDEIFQSKYNNPSWTFGQSPKFTFHNSRRFAAGRVGVYLDIAQGSVASCSIRGDFLGTVPIRGLEEQLENKTFTYQEFAAALDEISLQPYLGGISKSELLSCIFD